ncbi:acetylcholinesterase-like isoform X2 [Patiria miniata]|uniref:Carboxylic ester hydrolase n=1 Tax=Patiria miniata TaxID=46514 RepID=A0A913ZYG6_PATMI|nr:acetylcholinesterase-like isoform X2 [Patiria miniata]
MAVAPSLSQIFACIFAVFLPWLGNCDPVVNTTAGMIRGRHLTYDGSDSTHDVYVYKGIPYAEPPVGGLRFSAPAPKSPWNGTFNASTFGPSCPQDVSGVATFYPDYVVQIPKEATVINEDCLTLNVYSPFNISKGSTPVMVWIHGGSFETGQGSGYDASALAVRGRVVVVTINYRLNVFGFLSTNDENAPGNFGLLDQQLALKWVHENIAGFGGDPSRVTLFGQSAGGASAFLHLFANNSRPLFRRVAAHSGVFNPSYIVGKAKDESKIARMIGKAAGIASVSTMDNVELIQSLRNLSMDDLLTAALFVARQTPRQIFTPVLDNNVLSLTTGLTNLQHDVILLHTSGDGSTGLDVFKILLNDEIDPEAGVTKDQWISLLHALFKSGVSSAVISHEYINDAIEDENFARLKALVNMFLDFNYLAPMQAALAALPNSSSIYACIFDHRSTADTRLPDLNLVPHSEELSYLFGLPFNGLSRLGSNFTDQERLLSDRIITYWSNFAKSGDPNVNPDVNTTSNLTYWPEYGDSETYLLIQLNDSSVGQGYRKDKVMFWSDYLPKLTTAADEYCSNQRESMEPPTSDKPGCKIFIGEGLGLKLTQQQAETLIEVFMFVIIALLVILIIVFGALMGYKFKYKDRQAAIKKNGVQTNGDLKKNAAFEVNEGFTPEFEDTKM